MPIISEWATVSNSWEGFWSLSTADVAGSWHVVRTLGLLLQTSPCFTLLYASLLIGQRRRVLAVDAGSLGTLSSSLPALRSRSWYREGQTPPQGRLPMMPLPRAWQRLSVCTGCSLKMKTIPGFLGFSKTF